jgi:hypothetical protein
MGSLRITELDIDDGNLVHLCRHGASPEEIYQCLWNRKKVWAKNEQGDRCYLLRLHQRWAVAFRGARRSGRWAGATHPGARHDAR